jgi:hypothetical protein
LEYWSIGPPWRDLPETQCCFCNILRAGFVKLWPYKSGLGQGMMGSGESKANILYVFPSYFQFSNIPSLHYSMRVIKDKKLKK